MAANSSNKVTKPKNSKELSSAQSLAEKIKQKALLNMKEKKETAKQSESDESDKESATE